MTDPRDALEEPTGDSMAADTIFPEQEEPDVRVRRPVTAKGVALAGVRTVAGLAGIAIAATTIAAAALLPIPTIESTAPSQRVVPVPTAQQLVCPGGVLRLSDETGGGATIPSALGSPTVRSRSSAGSVDSTPVEQSDASSGGTASAPTIISTPPDPSDPTESILLSGAQSQQVDAGESVGLAAADCTSATSETWLVGGATTVGRTTLLSLANPTEVPATVDLELFGESGAIPAPGTSGIIVAASGQRVLSLAGFQPEGVSPVVHVTSVGGQVSASLQQSVVRGLTPGGVEVMQGAALSTGVVIPGVLVTDRTAVEALRAGGAAYDDVTTTLRLFAPGEEAGSATVNVVPEGGVGTGASFTLDLQGGIVVDRPLDEVGTGTYTVTIDATVPLVAAVRATSAAGPATDFAWSTAAPELQDTAQVTVAPGPAPVLHLANPGTADVTVELRTLEGTESSAIVPAGASTAVPVVSGETYTLSGFEQLFASVTLAGEGMIAGYPVHPPGVGSSPLTVYP